MNFGKELQPWVSQNMVTPQDGLEREHMVTSLIAVKEVWDGDDYVWLYRLIPPSTYQLLPLRIINQAYHIQYSLLARKTKNWYFDFSCRCCLSSKRRSKLGTLIFDVGFPRKGKIKLRLWYLALLFQQDINFALAEERHYTFHLKKKKSIFNKWLDHSARAHQHRSVQPPQCRLCQPTSGS